MGHEHRLDAKSSIRYDISMLIAVLNMSRTFAKAGIAFAISTLMITISFENAEAQRYTITPVRFPGTSSIDATGMNDAGYIVGTYVGTREAVHGFILHGSELEHIHGSGGKGFPEAAFPVSITNSNLTLSSSCGFSVCEGYTYKGAAPVSQFPLGTVLSTISQSQLAGINDKGLTIYRTIYLPSFSVSSYVGKGKNFVPLVPPQGFFADAYGINDAGTLSGVLYPASVGTGNYAAFTYSRGAFSLIEIPDAYNIDNSLINNKGEVAGTYSSSTMCCSHIWRYSHGKLSVVPTLEAHLYIRVSAINGYGDLAGVMDVPGSALHRVFVYRNDRFISLGLWSGAVSVGALTSDDHVLFNIDGKTSYIGSCTSC
jgi:hypothetical protein